MKKKNKSSYAVADKSKIRWDRFGISNAECPRCDDFKPNVMVGQEVICGSCGWKYKVVEKMGES